MSIVIFSGIDQVFSARDEFDDQTVKKLLLDLQEQNIPLIPITSKTRAEVLDWGKNFCLTSPFIIEQGSAIFIPQHELRFNLAETTSIDDYHLYQLGCNYTEARAALKVVQEEVSKILRGFGDMDEENIPSLIGGSIREAKKAKAREFSEYFLTPNRLEIEQLQQVATEYGFRIVPGNKLSLIIGKEAGVAMAIDWLKKNYQVIEGDLHTVGLGNKKQDLAWLEAVDIPVIIPTENEVFSCSEGRDWQISQQTDVAGWAESIRNICRQYL